LPANTHKQLIVIDFEYASANTPGLEFANHFTEWCYNYHDPVAPHACNTQNYPTEEEQRRFIKSYVDHRPQFNPRASATPKATPSAGPGSSISEFLLDSRNPGNAGNYAEEEAQREKYTNQRVKELMKEARLWRVANSAQWVAWGIVQAKVPELDDPQVSPSPDELTPGLPTPNSEASPYVSGLTSHEPSIDTSSTSLPHDHDKRPEGLTAEALLSGQNINDVTDEDAEFDYLGYAQERAMFFWGDVVALGLIKKEELPEGLRRRLKIVPY
jgi:choline kinase